MTTDTNPLGLDFFSFAWFFLTEVIPLSFYIITGIVMSFFVLVQAHGDDTLDRMVRRVIEILPGTNPYA